MIDINQIVKEVSKNTKVDALIVDTVCKHVFSFTEEVMKDKNDCHDILFNGLFKFKLKRRFKENKQKEYSAR